MPLHVFVRFEPQPGKELLLLDELDLILKPTRAEPGCICIHLYKATRDPRALIIHSEWTDDSAFDAHATLPHMARFLGLVDGLITRPLHVERTTQIA
ncbi:MAG: putative quinol monooxygenase [Candidatus Acidiferrum sp.]